METIEAFAMNKRQGQDFRGLRIVRAKQIFLRADPSTLRRLGQFLIECAEEMRGKKPFHRHFRDFKRSWQPHMIDVAVDRLE